MQDRGSGAKAAQEGLRLVEEQLRVGLWSWQRASNEVTWSPGLYSLLGLDPDSVQPNLPFLESLIHPRDRLSLDGTATLATDERQRSRRFRLIRPDGRLRWLTSTAQASFDRDGTVIRVVAVVQDTTESADLERRNAIDRAVLHVVADLMHVSIWRAGEDGRVLDMVENPHAVPTGREATTSSWRDLVHPEDLGRIAENWRDAVQRRARYEFTPRVLNRDGTYRTIRAVGLPLERAAGDDELHLAGVTLDDGRRLTAYADSNGPGDAGELFPAQVRAGRGFLGWSAEDLAAEANISVSTVRRLESETAQRPNAESFRQIRLAFERAGLAMWRSPDGRLCIAGSGE